MWYNIQVARREAVGNSLRMIRQAQDLGVAQLVARYLGVVEAASSSLVTQTK